MTLSDQRGPPLGRRRHGLLGGVSLGDALPNSKKLSVFFFGGTISARETAPLYFATALFASYGGGGGGGNGLPKGLAPLFALAGGLS